jgi:hypothetical protein
LDVLEKLGFERGRGLGSEGFVFGYSSVNIFHILLLRQYPTGNIGL